jgi:hypothetical protein
VDASLSRLVIIVKLLTAYDSHAYGQPEDVTVWKDSVIQELPEQAANVF